MLIELPIMITQLIEQEGDKKLFSFNDFITNITSELHNIKFKRTDTNEVLGCFHSVYPSTHSIEAKLNGGIINFVYELPNYRRQTIIYGDTIDLNSKIFISY